MLQQPRRRFSQLITDIFRNQKCITKTLIQLRMISCETPISEFTGLNLSTALYKLDTLYSSQPKISRRIERALTPLVEEMLTRTRAEFDSRTIPNVLVSTSIIQDEKLRKRLFSKFEGYALAEYKNFPAKSLVNLLKAYSKSPTANAAFMARIADECIERIEEFEVEMLAKLALYYADFTISASKSEKLYQLIAEHALPHLKECFSRFIPYFLFGFAKKKLSIPDAFLEELLVICRAKVSEFSNVQFVDLFWSISLLKPSELEAFMADGIKRAIRLSIAQNSVLLWSLGESKSYEALILRKKCLKWIHRGLGVQKLSSTELLYLLSAMERLNDPSVVIPENLGRIIRRTSKFFEGSEYCAALKAILNLSYRDCRFIGIVARRILTSLDRFSPSEVEQSLTRLCAIGLKLLGEDSAKGKFYSALYFNDLANAAVPFMSEFNANSIADLFYGLSLSSSDSEFCKKALELLDAHVKELNGNGLARYLCAVCKMFPTDTHSIQVLSSAVTIDRLKEMDLACIRSIADIAENMEVVELGCTEKELQSFRAK